RGDVVLCDFGGTMRDAEGVGYCSDITRCVHVGEPPAEVAEAYAVLHQAQRAAVAAAVVGTPCEEVDEVARRVTATAGSGDRFIPPTGPGIGVEEHEDPYIVAGNATPLTPGHAFSVEPGIYVPGRFGLRLEDIVAAADAGPDGPNRAAHAVAPAAPAGAGPPGAPRLGWAGPGGGRGAAEGAGSLSLVTWVLPGARASLPWHA